MSKYEILEKKLNDVKKSIGKIETSRETTSKYLVEFENYVDMLILDSHERKIRNSNGAVLGLTRGISDYDELCANEDLWEAVQNADKFYATECDMF